MYTVPYSCLHDAEIAALIAEDVPYFDLTTTALGIGSRLGRMTFTTRHDTVICATEEAAQVLHQCGAVVEQTIASGSRLPPGHVVLQATGPAAALHRGWKIAVNLLEYSSGIAGRMHAMVQTAQQVNPAVNVVTTRKMFPGTRALSIKAVQAGGALPHRLGLSETILVFEQHRAFTGGMAGLLDHVSTLQHTCREKRVVVEIETLEEALLMLEAGVRYLQFDKLPVERMTAAVQAIREIAPETVIAAAGGITRDSIAAYAATGVDVLVTSAPYFGKPADISARMTVL
ncbi:MAG: ModD protein [Chloroflexaceae bacterium]|nr:ModD protein [Chloroflexaceae bacterium]